MPMEKEFLDAPGNKVPEGELRKATTGMGTGLPSSESQISDVKKSNGAFEVLGKKNFFSKGE